MRNALRYPSIAVLAAVAACAVSEGTADEGTEETETPKVKAERPKFGGVAKGPGGIFVLGPDSRQLVVGDTVKVTTDDAIFTWEIISLQVGQEPELDLKKTEVTIVVVKKKKRRARDPFSPVGYTP
jgi:hypothetical protein